MYIAQFISLPAWVYTYVAIGRLDRMRRWWIQGTVDSHAPPTVCNTGVILY